jgi:hypothetical protein
MVTGSQDAVHEPGRGSTAQARGDSTLYVDVVLNLVARRRDRRLINLVGRVRIDKARADLIRDRLDLDVLKILLKHGRFSW